MAMSVNPAIEGNLSASSGQRDPAAMIGPRSTVPIRARGHVVPRSQAAHMTATGRTCTRRKTLASRGPSTHDPSGKWCDEKHGEKANRTNGGSKPMIRIQNAWAGPG
jgi:hypothetical protein